MRRSVTRNAVACCALLIAHCAFVASPLWACPMCKDSIPSGMSQGFFWSVLLMISVPVVVVGVIAGVLWRAEQRKRQLLDAPHG